MKILSISFNNLSPFKGAWTIDLSNDEYIQSGAFVFYATSAKYAQTLIDAMSLALFGTTKKNNNAATVDKSLFADTHKAISAAVRFIKDDNEYTSEWHCKSSLKTEWTLKDSNGKPIKHDECSSIETFLGFGLSKFLSLIRLDPKSFSNFLKSTAEERASSLQSLLGSDVFASIPTLTETIMKQKRDAVEVSRKKAETYDLKLVPEEKLNSDLQKTRGKIAQLKASIQRQEDYCIWLQKIESLKDELFKIAKEESELRADIARFDTKRPALDLANKAIALSDDFNKIMKLREELGEAQKLLDERKKTLAQLQEKVRASNAALLECDTARKQAESTYGNKKALLEKVKTIEERISTLTSQLKVKSANLEKVSAGLKLTAETSQQFKNDVANCKGRLGFVQKKLSDLGLSEKIISEIDGYKAKIDSLTQLENDAQEARKNQRQCQKAIEKLKSELQDCETRMAALKKDELTIQNEMVLKRRSITKLTGKTDLDNLTQELDSYNEKITGIKNLEKSVEQLTKLSEDVNSEKTQISKGKNDLKVATATVHAAVQTLRDKTTIVANCEELLEFHKKIISLQEHRKSLENGKPCPLCGSVHHPYAASTPVSGSIEDKLTEAIKEKEKATATHQEAIDKYNKIRASLNNSEQLAVNAGKQIEELKKSILSTASSLKLTGLKEKKVMTWGSVIKQKLSVITNKRDELANKLARCDQFNSTLKDSEEKLNKTYSDIQFLTDLISSKKVDLDQTDSLLQKHAWAEANSNQQQEEIVKELERIYTKYGLKATSPTMLKQQFPFLLGRRNDWVELDAELHKLEERIKQSEQKIDASSSEQRQHKEASERLTAEIANLGAEIKQLNKDKNELLASQNSADFGNLAEKELAGAKTAYEEALGRKEEHLKDSNNYQKDVDKAQTRVSELEKQLTQLNGNFDTAMKEAGFTSESQFKSSLASKVKAKKLQQEDETLVARLAALQEKKENKKKEYAEQEALNLTSETLSKVKENIEKAQASLEDSVKAESQLTERIEQNKHGKQRYAIEFEDLNRKRDVSAKWEHLYETVNTDGLELFEPSYSDLAFEVLVEQANKQLWLIKPTYSLETSAERSYDLLLKSNKDPTQAKTSKDFDANESFMVSYALALAQRQLNSLHNELANLFIDGNISRTTKIRKEALLNGFKQLKQQGVLFGVISTSAADKDVFKACVSVDTDGPSPKLLGSGVSAR